MNAYPNKMEVYAECKHRMFSCNGDIAFKFKKGDNVLQLEDLNTQYIDQMNKEGGGFYWCFFNGMYISDAVADVYYEYLDFDKLQYNRHNEKCLELVYPILTARARLVGDEVLARVIRKVGYDVDRLACQCYSTTIEFDLEFFVNGKPPIHPVIKNPYIGRDTEVVLTTHNLKDNVKRIDDFLHPYEKDGFDKVFSLSFQDSNGGIQKTGYHSFNVFADTGEKIIIHSYDRNIDFDPACVIKVGDRYKICNGVLTIVHNSNNFSRITRFEKVK